MFPHRSKILVLCPALLVAPCLAQDLEAPAASPANDHASAPSDPQALGEPAPVIDPAPGELPPPVIPPPANYPVAAADLPPPPPDNVPGLTGELEEQGTGVTTVKELQAPVVRPPSGFANAPNPFLAGPIGGAEEVARRLHLGFDGFAGLRLELLPNELQRGG